MRVLIALTLGFTLAGCGTWYDEPPEKPVLLVTETQQQWCEEALRLSSNQYLDTDTQQTLLEEIRSRGCPTPSPQLVAH
jgi:hypothetical protein